MRVLVAGSEGVLGSALCRSLAERHEVVKLDRPGVAATSMTLAADIRDGRALGEVLGELSPLDAVVHTAVAPSGDGSDADRRATWEFEVSVLGTWNLLDLAVRLGVKRIVYISSLNVYGALEGGPLTEELDLIRRRSRDVTEPYGLAKRLAEQVVEYVCVTRGLTGIALRLDSLHSPGRMERRGIHVDHVSHAVEHALRADLEGFHVVNLTADPSRFNAPNDRARDLLGWEPTVVFERNPALEDWSTPSQPPL